jgi:hypothetical protein
MLVRRLLFGAFIYSTLVGVVVIAVTDHYKLWDVQVPFPVSLAVTVLLGAMLLRAKVRLWLHKRAVNRVLSR